MKKLSLALIALLAALLVVARPARADETSDEFKAHVQRAKVHYDLGEFEDAAEEYTQAYRIKAVPGALFNIAQAYRQASKYDKARQFYRAYLREANPEPKQRAVVERAIKELDELIAKEEKTKNSAPKGVPPLSPGRDDDNAHRAAAQQETLLPPVPERSSAAAASVRPPAETSAAATAPAGKAKPAAVSTRLAPGKSVQPENVAVVDTQANKGKSHTWAYVTGGVALALLAGGAVFAVEASKTDSNITGSPHDRATADSLISTSKTDHMLSAVLFGVGAAAAVGAGVLFFVPTSGPSGGTGAAVGGHF